MKTSFVRKMAALFVSCLLAFTVCGVSLTEEYSAQTMRLTHYEGNVEILNPSGEPRFVMENVRFASGEAIRTDVESFASVSLDATKIVTMDQLTHVEFTKEGGRIVMKLKDGSMLLDVQKKLDKTETLDIETSTMSIGIRGTIVTVSDFPVDQEPESVSASNADAMNEVLITDVIGTVHGRRSVLCVLEGVATLTYRDTDGVEHTIQVKAGEKAVLSDRLGDGQADEPTGTEELYPEDLGDFVVKQVENNPTLKDRIDNASDVLTRSKPLHKIVTNEPATLLPGTFGTTMP